LGSYATVYLEPGEVARARAALASVPGVEAVLARDEAAAQFSLPADRIGGLVVLGDRSTVLGQSAAYHDLSAVRHGLGSPGGLKEGGVPLAVTSPLRHPVTRPLTNGDIFDLVLNEVA